MYGGPNSIAVQNIVSVRAIQRPPSQRIDRYLYDHVDKSGQRTVRLHHPFRAFPQYLHASNKMAEHNLYQVPKVMVQTQLPSQMQARRTSRIRSNFGFPLTQRRATTGAS